MTDLLVSQARSGANYRFAECMGSDTPLRSTAATLCFNGFYVAEEHNERDGSAFCVFIGSKMSPDSPEVVAAVESLLADHEVAKIRYARCAPKAVDPALEDGLQGAATYKDGVNQWFPRNFVMYEEFEEHEAYKGNVLAANVREDFPNLHVIHQFVSEDDTDTVQVLVTDNADLAKGAQALADEEIKFRIYSGRGFYGKCTVAAHTSDNTSSGDIRKAFAAIDEYDPYVDSMGLGKVIYMGQKAQAIDLEDLMPGWREEVSPSKGLGL